MSARPMTDKPPIFRMLDDPRIQKGMAAVAGKFLTPEKMLRLCINAVKKTPRLLECDPQTVLGAMMTSAALGLEPNTVQQQAFLIPYKRRAKVDGKWIDVYDCQFQIGARGFLTLAYRVPEIRMMKAEAIHDGDLWEHMEGSESFLRYAKALRDRGSVRGAFSFVKMDGGIESACVLPLEEIEKIRSRSETYRALTRNVAAAESDNDRARAQQQLDETPWVMWFDDMAAKSAIKKHSKQLPLTGSEGSAALMAAGSIDSRSDVAEIDLRMMADPDVARSVVQDGEDAPAAALTNDPSPTLEQATPSVRMPKARQAQAVERQAQPEQQAGQQQTTTTTLASASERAFIEQRLKVAGISVEDACAEVGIKRFEDLTADGFIVLKEYLAGR